MLETILQWGLVSVSVIGVLHVLHVVFMGTQGTKQGPPHVIFNRSSREATSNSCRKGDTLISERWNVYSCIEANTWREEE